MSENPKHGVIGDFSTFHIIDRVGKKTDRIDNLFSDGTFTPFSWESGLVDYWRNSGGTTPSGGTQP